MYKERYQRRKEEILRDKSINTTNRKIIKKFLENQEIRLKRKNGLSEVDERSYKTLYFYIGRLKNINNWFKNKEWNKLTQKEIEKVINDLEDAKIVTERNKERFADRSLYYQMLGGRLFDIAGVSHHARKIIKEFELVGRKNTNKVRFIPEEDFRKIVDCAISPEQRCLLWLAFDIGENINSLLELEKKDFKKQINEDTKEPEYFVILSEEKLKRSRTARTEITNYNETVKFLDIILSNLKPTKKIISNKSMKNRKLSEIHGEDKLFKFGSKAAEQFLKRASEKAGVRCQPEGQNITWKDLRSSMSCDLLKKGWNRDEVNARLGHTPSSRVIDRYINFLALDKNKPKKKIYDSSLKKVESELGETKDLAKLQTERISKLNEKLFRMEKTFEELSSLPDVMDFIKMVRATGGLNSKQLEQMREQAQNIEEDLRFEKQFKGLNSMQRKKAIVFFEKEKIR